MAPFSGEILYFTGANCRICTLMTPLVADVAEEFDGTVVLTEMDAAEFAALASEQQVMAVPALIALSEGVEVGRAVGAQTPGALRRLFRAASSGDPVKPSMNPRDRLVRLMFVVALGVLAISTGQFLVWAIAVVALVVAFWDKTYGMRHRG